MYRVTQQSETSLITSKSPKKKPHYFTKCSLGDSKLFCVDFGITLFVRYMSYSVKYNVTNPN